MTSVRFFVAVAASCVCLTGCLARIDSICSVNPALQMLRKGTNMHHFGCVVNETTHTLNCSRKGVPALPQTSDIDVGIEVLDFSNNYLKCLPKINNTKPTCSIKDCHIGCLLDLRLQNNEIEFLHDEVFLNLTCLNNLDLSHNVITNETLKRHHFFRLNHLRHLDLHGNPLRTLPDNVLISAHLSHLHTLNLSSCELEKIGEVAIDDFFELEVLDLQKNKLSALVGRTFQGLTSLRVLDLRWNRLDVIEKDTFGDLRNLQELRLDHNRLYRISATAFHTQVPLTHLSLVVNRFSQIPVAALQMLKKLQSLDMSYNPFTRLEPGSAVTSVTDLKLDHLDNLTVVLNKAFSAFPRLSRLSLRFCYRLTTIERKAFSWSSKNLSEVRLNDNGLLSLPENLLPWKQMRLLTLDRNPWVCDCFMGWTAGHVFGNTTLRCDKPVKLKGQELQSLTSDELECPRGLIGIKAVIGLSIIVAILVILALVIYHKKYCANCWCVWGTKGSYVTVYTKRTRKSDDDDELNDSSCADGDVDDLDLGAGDQPSSEGGRVMILLNTFRNGYRRLKSSEGESTRDLTSNSEV